MFQVQLLLLTTCILILLENQVCRVQSKNSGELNSVSDNSGGSNTFYLHGRQHELPTLKVISKGKTHLLGNGTTLNIPAVSNSEATKPLFEIIVIATYPLYVFYDRITNHNTPWLVQKRYSDDFWNEISYVFELRWSVFLSSLKSKNTSVEFRSNIAPFFGSSVQCFYNQTDDTVSLHNSPEIPNYRSDFFEQRRQGMEKAGNCDAFLYRYNRNKGQTGVLNRLYGCSFGDGSSAELFLNKLEINRVPLDGSSVAHENCIKSCESFKECALVKLNTFSSRPWSSYGYCTNGVTEGSSRKKVYFSPIYVSLPQGATQTPEIYFKREDIRLDKMISLDPIEEYHNINSVISIRCNISEAFAATPMRFAIKYKGIKDLDFLPVKDRDNFTLALWSRSTTYTLELDRTDTERILCFAPLHGSFGWINASLPIKVTEPMSPSFLHDLNWKSEEIPKTKVSTFSEQKTFVLGSANKSLACYAVGHPSPEITWTWNRVKVSESKGENKPHEVAWSQLFFSQIHKTTEGEYTCIATNTQGIAQATINVIVTDGSDTSLALSVSLAVIALVLIAVVIVTIVLIKRTKSSKKVLSKQEYQNFLHGNFNENNSNPNSNIFAKAFDPRFIIKKPNLIFDIDYVLGTGQYGVVMKGWLKDSENGKSAVAVKTTKDNVDVMYVKALISEVKIMAYIGDHPNVIKFLGSCIENLMDGKLLVVVEFCSKGDLLGCLRKEKALVIESLTTTSADEFKSTGNQTDADTQMSYDLPPNLFMELVQWSRDIASGMAYIGSKGIIHGDLAARNILLNGENVAKISDFGLSRQLLQDYTVYKKKTTVPLPWKWMALESLTTSDFSVKSDTWAFGITLWEIFSLGDSPYPGCIYDEEFVQKLSSGFCPSKPKFASDEWYQIMRSCWNVNPELRPEMSFILDQIKEQHINVAGPKIAENDKSNYTIVIQ